MSSTNETPKCAKQTATAAPPPLPLQPSGTEKTRKRRTLWILVGAVFSLILAAGVALLLLFLMLRQGERVGAKERHMTEQSRQIQTDSESASTTSGVAWNAEQPVPTLPGENDTNSLPVAQQDELSMHSGPKLQGISFNPARPCALVSGKTVYVGDTVGGFSVTQITMESVTLVSTLATNVLSLSQ